MSKMDEKLPKKYENRSERWYPFVSKFKIQFRTLTLYVLKDCSEPCFFFNWLLKDGISGELH